MAYTIQNSAEKIVGTTSNGSFLEYREPDLSNLLSERNNCA